MMILGDFNAHKTIWDSKHIDNKGKIVEDWINKNNLSLMNSQDPIYIHPATGTQSFIDLSICHPTLLLNFEWYVYPDLCGSDHFPICIQLKTNTLPDQPEIPKWKFGKLIRLPTSRNVTSN